MDTFDIKTGKKMISVSMIGCGNLGLNCAEVMAEHYDVVGFDLKDRTPSNFSMVSTLKEAIDNKDFIFIAIPTPHDERYGGEMPSSNLPPKDFEYKELISVLNEINHYVSSNQTVVLISTVLTGTIRNVLKNCISNCKFIYNPYLIAMGTVKWDMVNPEMVIIGTETGDNAQHLIDFYQPLMKNNPRYEVGTWDEAESIKMFYNTFISMKLSFVNMIQDVAEINKHIDVDKVTSALSKSTKMITGPGYMKAGMGAGGACHPRDSIALRYLAEKLNLGYDIFETIALSREVQAERMAKRCLDFGKNVCIVGKSYKAKVSSTVGSPSMLVGHYIVSLGGNLKYYDFNTGDNEFPKTDVYLISYWEEWVTKINWPPGAVVIDPWRQLAPIEGVKVIHYGNTRF
jgi:UDPglucose 6-dehydrogenase